MTIEIYTDGACRGNPGKSGAGAVVYQDDMVIEQISKYLGDRLTNNEAEYLAVLHSIHFLIERKFTQANFYCDSQLLVKQLNGQYKVKAPTIIPLHKEIKALSQNLNIKFTWIRREENTVADALANKAIDEHRR
jgi:ribonuclease HI